MKARSALQLFTRGRFSSSDRSTARAGWRHANALVGRVVSAVALSLISARAAPRGRVDRRGGRPRASLDAMPLTQITDVFDEPLDLWLSRNHEGQRRYVRADALASAGASGAAPPAADPATAPPADADTANASSTAADAEDSPAAPDDAGALCEFIPGSGASPAVPSWLSSGASPALPDVDDALAPRVPLPAPVGLIGQIPPVPSVIPDPVERARRVAAEEAARVFSSEAGVPTVFVARPPADVTCRVCRDVFLDPVIADDGFTYCRRCVPSADDHDDPDALGADDLAPDHEARAKVAASRVLCRNGLKILDNADGVNRWVYDPEGCPESVPYESRAAHEDECGYARAACGLPGIGRGVDSCPTIVLRRERASHRAACPFRLVPCPVPGCDRTVQHNRKAQHVSGCEFRTAKCPNGCGWGGRRGEATAHRTRCGLETTTCGREDTENPSSSCAFRAERRFMASHETECEYRAVACAHCGRGVSARHAATHESSCAERRELCEACGANVLARRAADHARWHCGRATSPCDFAPYGCTERGTREELERHALEDAPRHLRLVALAVEGAKASYLEWYRDVDEVRRTAAAHVASTARDVDAVARDVRRSEEEGKAEVERLRVALADLRAHYEEEVERLRARSERARVDAAARLRDVEAENAALREVLASKMTREEAETLRASFRTAVEKCEGEVEETRDAVERHKTRWERDVGRVREEVAAARRACDESVEEVRAKIQHHAASDHLRVEAVEKELHEANKDFIEDLDELAARQRDLEQRWRSANETLRGERQPSETPADKRWAATREHAAAETRAVVARPKGMGTAMDEAALGRFRAQGAAELLFGRGSRTGRRDDDGEDDEDEDDEGDARMSGRVGVGSVPRLARPTSGGARARTTARPAFR